MIRQTLWANQKQTYQIRCTTMRIITIKNPENDSHRDLYTKREPVIE
jgi:hypothetical protein